MYDIIIVGNGLAGLSAAITCAEAKARVLLASSNQPERSQSVMAEGGINAALDIKGEDDSPAQHAADTLRAGCDLADEKAVAGLTAAAPEIIDWADRLGTVFSRDSQGRVDQRCFGGQKKKRTAYANAGIGRQLMAALSRHCRKLESEGLLQVREDLRLVSLALGDRGCGGAVFRSVTGGEPQGIAADGVILCCGGPGGLFGNNTGSTLSDGAAAASLFAQGAAMANLEMIQYHPTTAAGPGKRLLISEAARGEGGRLFTYKEGKPWYFMEEWFPEGGNLMPRDVVSRSIYKAVREQDLGVEGRDEVLLDISFLPEEVRETRLAEICRNCRTFLGLDPAREPIPVWPGVHYFMGGLYVGADHACSIPRLWAAGECACQYHGANRLGGNSNLGAIYGGRVAANSALSLAPLTGAAEKEVLLEGEVRRQSGLAAAFSGSLRPPALRQRLQELMREAMAIFRSEERLAAALASLDALEEEAQGLCGGKEAPD
ncbi:MAG: FAD-binding protein, partial [Firmicutes bacterium]|nr:FAD-binding protein [Bacillota bacterium]